MSQRPVSSRVKAAMVLSEIFPPAIGGSGELLRQVYVRCPELPTTVLADRIDGIPDRSSDGHMVVERSVMRAREWGLMSREAIRYHVRQARRIRRQTRRADTIVHAARALPEGVGAWMANWTGGPHYACWAHGEDVASARTSRELDWLMKRVLRRASAVFCNSRNTAAMVERIGVRDDRIVIVHPGVDTARFGSTMTSRVSALRQQLRASDECVLLTVGRLQRRKGHDLMLEAVIRLREQGRRVRYVIVGDGEERHRLETMAVDIGASPFVNFVGVVPADELPTYYAAADIFCHPNRVDGHDVEGFGIVFLEAAAARLPVVGGDSGGVPEAVDRDITGLLVSGTDAGELTSALRTLVDDPALRKLMGDAGSARVSAHFSWDRAAAIVRRAHERIAGVA